MYNKFVMKYVLEDKILKIDISSLFYERIQDFFDDLIPSKKIQHLLIQNKWIKLDGNPVKREDYIVGLNLEINIYPESYEYKHLDNVKLDVVYEDEIMLVVNKPKDVLVHSDGNNEETTLKDWVESYYSDKNYIDATPIHRLDKETTGLVIFSKSIIFQPLLDKLLSEKQIRRNYMAFVKGKMEEGQSLFIDKAIGKDRHDSSKRVIYKDGQEARTRVKSLGCNKSKDYSVLRCVLDTGRTHQIRVHLASEHLPILNDSLYGVESNLCIRMGLVADELEFYHPLKEEMMNIDHELPNDLRKLYFEVLK